MVSILDHRHRSTLFRKFVESDRIDLSTSRSLIRFSRLSFIGLLIVLINVVCYAQQESEKERGLKPVEEAVVSVDLGAYHALIIGINEYSVWPQLKFAEGDASDIRHILVTRYGFALERVTYLSGANATRSKILSSLRAKLESLGEDENLLVYYAGHGQLDPLTENGYWIPVEGGLYDESGWIAFSNIQTLLTGLGVRAKSVIVLTDSCYGGALARSGPTPGHRGFIDEEYKQYEQRLAKLAKKRSRQIIASGGYEQVPDRSFFADLLKQALEDNTYPMVDLEYLFFDKIYPKLRFIGQQEPALTRLVSGPEDDGQFVLLQKTKEIQIIVDNKAPKIVSFRANPSSVSQGESSTLSWQTENAQSVHITEIGRVELSGSMRVNPSETATYRLIVENEQEVNIEKTLTIDVSAQPPRILSFQADRLTIKQGETSSLHWQVSDATDVSINGKKVQSSGSMAVNSQQSSKYVLTAENREGATVTEELRIRVVVPEPEIVRFETKSPIAQGNSSILTWETLNTEQVEISGVGRVSSSGTKRVRPDTSTTYTLIAKNRNGSQIRQKATVKVNPRLVDADRVKVYQNPESVCSDLVQGKIAWDYKGNKRWSKENVQRLCRGTSNGSQPVNCIKRVMHGGINWGGGTRWKWKNAIDLCEGTNNASKTAGCFQNKIRAGVDWQNAIRACQTR